MTTKRDVDKSPFLIVKNQQNNDVKLVVSPSNFQVGLTNSPSSLTVTGHATFQQGVTSNNPVYFYQGLSGSLTKLTDGTSYLVAGNNVTITSASNGQVIISSTAGGGGSGDVVGPASATDNAIVRFDLTTGKLIQNSAVTIADTTGNITTPGDIAVNGGDVTTIAGTATLFNTNATILNLGGAATTVEIGAATGTTSVNNSLTVDGSATLGDAAADVITVNGTTTFVGAGVTTTFAGDIAINGGDITTTAATFNIANANATTVNIGGAATAVGVGSSTGVTTINNRLSATGGTFLLLDAELGNAAVGSHPAFESTTPTVYALFGHKDLNHAVDGNYALVQSNAGDTFIGASSTRDIYFKNGTDAIGQLSNDTVSFTGKSGTATTMTLGNTSGVSSTTIDAGTGNINIGTSDSSRTTNIATAATTNQIVNIGNTQGLSYSNIYGGSFGVYMSASFIMMSSSYPRQNLGADAIIGAAEIGSLPGFSNQYAMFGHQALDHTLGNYAIVQENDGDTYLNAPESKYVYFTSAGDSAQNGYIGYTGAVIGTLINFQGRSGQRAAVTIGNATSTSATSMYAGSGGITLSGSGGQTVITGSTTSYTDATIGAWEIGSLPATQGTFPNVYAFVGHKDLNHSSDGNYALVQSNVGDTFIGAVSTKDVYFKNGTSFIGQISNDTISFTGSPAASVTTVVGSITGSSSTSIYAGSGGLFLSGSATTTAPGTIITGSRPTSVSDAFIGPLEVGIWPSNAGYGMIMHKDLAYTNEYALLQQNNGNTYLNCGAAASTLLRYNGTTRIQLNSTGIGFFGATPVAQQTGGAATADLTYDATERDMINRMYTALRNYGLLT